MMKWMGTLWWSGWVHYDEVDGYIMMKWMGTLWWSGWVHYDEVDGYIMMKWMGTLWWIMWMGTLWWSGWVHYDEVDGYIMMKWMGTLWWRSGWVHYDEVDGYIMMKWMGALWWSGWVHYDEGWVHYDDGWVHYDEVDGYIMMKWMGTLWWSGWVHYDVTDLVTRDGPPPLWWSGWVLQISDKNHLIRMIPKMNFVWFPREMDFSHHKSPNPTRVAWRQEWDSETSGQKTISHGKPYKMHFLAYFKLWGMCNVAQSLKSWKPCEMDLSQNWSQHGGKDARSNTF